VDQCGENKDATNQLTLPADNSTFITSSQFKSSTCNWQITTSAGYILQVYVIQLKFTGYKCDEEYLKVYDGKTLSDKLMEEYCPTKPRRISNSLMWSSGENVIIEYKQGSAVDDNGLKFMVSSSKKTNGKKFHHFPPCFTFFFVICQNYCENLATF